MSEQLRVVGAWTALIVVAPILGVLTALMYVVLAPRFVWEALRKRD